MANNKSDMYGGIGIMCALLGIGGVMYGINHGEVAVAKANADVNKSYIELQTEMVKQGIITNVSQIKFSELEKKTQ